MPTKLIVPVVLSGGSGTRLWPLSTSAKPKQFLNLLGGTSLLQQTIERVDDRRRFRPPVVVGAEHHQKLLMEQLAHAGVEDATTILEPVARNTAVAIALAAHLAAPDDLLLVLPSDHAIQDQGAFMAAVEVATPLANDDWLVTFGVEPTGPETGYGYIAMGNELGGVGARRVDRFVEKPDRARAEAMVADGRHVWNAGIFLFRADAILTSLRHWAPEIADAVAASVAGLDGRRTVVHPASDALEDCPASSIDVAVLERAERVACVPVSMGWSDVGSWDALDQLRSAQGAVDGADAMLIDADGSSIHSEGVRVTISGVRDVFVIATNTDVLVIPKGESQRVKDVVARLRRDR